MTKETNSKIKKKKKKLKWYIKLLIIILIIIIYSFYIGTKGIFIKDYNIKSKKITDKMHGIKILQFSDLHFKSSVNKNDVKKIIKKINSANPDIVIFTGDLFDKNKNITEEDKIFLTKQLSNINADYGKYYVTGECDNDNSNNVLNNSEFTNIEENAQVIDISNDSSILLIDNKKSKDYFNENTDNNLKILVIHNPNNFDKVKEYKFDMVISGHTHNGQINIPKIKETFINGKYTKNYQKIENTKLFVNPGIGTKGLKVRLFNHPTMFLYRLNKTSK